MKQLVLSILFFVVSGSNPIQTIKPDSIHVSVKKVEIDSSVYIIPTNPELERHTSNAKAIKEQSKQILIESLKLLEKAKQKDLENKSQDAFIFYQNNLVIE